jgi:FKBP-type peptidyl-prolyl cis-trans isomerase (trigger factor)
LIRIIDLKEVNVTDAEKEAFLTKRVGDVVEVVMTKMNHQKVRCTIKAIQTIDLAEFNDELAKEVSKGKFDNVDDFKENLSFEMQRYFDAEARKLLENNIVEELVEMHEDIEVPEVSVKEASRSIVKRLLANMTGGQQPIEDKYITDEMLEAYRPMGEKSVIWELVKEAIIEKESIKLEDYDFEDWAEENLAGLEEDKKKSTLAEMKAYGYIQPQLLQKKVIDLIMDFAEIMEVDFDNNPLVEEDEPVAEVVEEAADEKKAPEQSQLF